MQLIFVHGWGYGPEIWAPLLDRLDFSTKVQCVDLGYFRDQPHIPDIEDSAVGIGHSLGLMWLLKNNAHSLAKLVSIAGFDRFTPHINPRMVKAMKAGVDRNTERQLKSFWKNCNTENYIPMGEPNPQTLNDGLDALLTWDACDELTSFAGPKLVLGAKDDKITPYQMQCDIWGMDNIVWNESGGHMLPLTQPDWVAKQIIEFIYD